MWPSVVGLLVVTNLVAFGAMGLDKRRAARRARRIPERTLLLLALPLASPGAWLASRLFRHKTRKFRFRLWLSLVTLVNAVTVWVLAQALR